LNGIIAGSLTVSPKAPMIGPVGAVIIGKKEKIRKVKGNKITRD
jgi:hypothetical protein